MAEELSKLIGRLPVWAQKYIRNLQMERDMAIRTLREFEDTQAKSRIWYDDMVCTGEQVGPSNVRRYVQARNLSFAVGKREVTVGYNNNGDLYVGAERGVVFIPEAHNRLFVYPEERIVFERGGEDDR